MGIWWHNRKEIYKAHEYGLRVIFKDSSLKAGKMKVKYLSDTIAVVHARMILRNQTAVDDDTNPDTRQTNFTFTAHKKSKLMELRIGSQHRYCSRQGDAHNQRWQD